MRITYLYFCTLGGIASGKCYKQEHRNGNYIYFTYHLR